MNTVVRLGFILTILLILVLTVTPIENLRAHAHWGKVTWVPFGDRHLIVRDMVANTLLFVPFGALGPWRGRPLATRVLVAGACAFALSSSVELCQVFSHSRLPTTTDVVTNTAGALLGAAFPVRIRRPARA
jgi:glycopeptide antibiotics resistance protein